MHYTHGDNFIGGFSDQDGTVDFFSRVCSIINPSHKVLDLGAGRGAWHQEIKSPFKRTLRDLKPRCAEYIGADIDPIVLENPTTHRNVIIDERGNVPIANECLDVVVADYVLEHVEDPSKFASEIARILKPGGMFCARTPHSFHYVSIAARFLSLGVHKTLLRSVQPTRESRDVFGTHYKMNSLAKIEEIFPGWKNSSFVYGGYPSYYFGTREGFLLMEALQRVMPRVMYGNLFVFVEKPKAERRG